MKFGNISFAVDDEYKIDVAALKILLDDATSDGDKKWASVNTNSGSESLLHVGIL
jgi:hypothetical protein